MGESAGRDCHLRPRFMGAMDIQLGPSPETHILPLSFLRKQGMHVPFDVLPRRTCDVVPRLVTSGPVSGRSFALAMDRYVVTYYTLTFSFSFSFPFLAPPRPKQVRPQLDMAVLSVAVENNLS